MIDLGGTYRTVSPAETLAKVNPMLWKDFGITRVANITGLDHIGIPTYLSIRPQAKLLTTAQGKGISDELAKISAIMESIEGWHCENMPEPDLFGSYRNLKESHPLTSIHPSMNHGPFEWMDIENLDIPWAKGLDLLTGKELYFPYTTLNVNTAYYRPGYRYFPPTTNGLASGNTLDEAICHALFEVIERETEAANVPFMTQPQIDISTIRSPHLLDLLNKIEKSRLSLEVWALKNRFNIPCYAVVIHDADDIRGVGMQFGSGAHFSSVVALSRAITEAVQGRATMISGSRDDHSTRLYKQNKTSIPPLLNAFRISREQSQPFIETIAPNNFKSCLQDLLSRLKNTGYPHIFLYNHTRELFDIPVVHVAVPGFRYAHGSCFSCSVSS
jgi:YcaO-like protein with predicted kinase domain